MIKKNKKGFVFVETIITITILLASVLSIYVYYNSFIINEKKRLYYDDITYVHKTMALRDLIYSENVAFQEGVNIYKGVEALQHYLAKKTTYNKWYSIGKSQTIFMISDSPVVIDASENVRKLFEEYHITGSKSGFYYIPRLSDLKDSNINIQHQNYPPNKKELWNYLDKLTIPCESTRYVDPPATSGEPKHPECNNYKGIFVSIIYELKSGGSAIDYTNYEECMKTVGATRMQCETVTYISWVYA